MFSISALILNHTQQGSLGEKKSSSPSVLYHQPPPVLVNHLILVWLSLIQIAESSNNSTFYFEIAQDSINEQHDIKPAGIRSNVSINSVHIPLTQYITVRLQTMVAYEVPIRSPYRSDYVRGAAHLWNTVPVCSLNFLQLERIHQLATLQVLWPLMVKLSSLSKWYKWWTFKCLLIKCFPRTCSWKAWIFCLATWPQHNKL